MIKMRRRITTALLLPTLLFIWLTSSKTLLVQESYSRLWSGAFPRDYKPRRYLEYIKSWKSGVGTWKRGAWIPSFTGPWVPIDELTRISYPLFILFLGDSLTQNLFLEACRELNLSSIDLLDGFEACGGLGINQDQHLFVYSLLCGSNDPPYFMYCRTGIGGNSKFSWNYTISRHLHTITTSLIEKTQRDPDIISVHFGVWDLANEWSAATKYGVDENQTWFNKSFISRWQENVQHRLTYLSQAFPETMLFYRTNGPIIAEKLKDGITQSRLRPEYALALSVASKAFDSVAHVIDFHQLMAKHSEASIDGLHYTGGSMYYSYFAIMLNIFASSAASMNAKNLNEEQNRRLQSERTGQKRTEQKDHFPCIVFLHIPKTAGTEFRASLLEFEMALARQRGIQNHETYQTLENYAAVESMPPARGFISGHWTGKLPFIANYSNCTFITVLRHPVERARSAFNYHGHPHSHWRCLRNHTYQDCRVPGRAPWNWYWLDNDVVRQLAGLRHWNRMDIFNYLKASDTYREREDFQDGNAIWKLYTELAIETLQQIDYICFTDDLRRCLEKLKYDFGVTDWNISVSHRNQGSSKKQDKDLEERIAIANPYDLAIWHYAQEFCSSFKCRSQRLTF